MNTSTTGRRLDVVPSKLGSLCLFVDSLLVSLSQPSPLWAVAESCLQPVGRSTPGSLGPADAPISPSRLCPSLPPPPPPRPLPRAPSPRPPFPASPAALLHDAPLVPPPPFSPFPLLPCR
jgi:hypothetical protein